MVPELLQKVSSENSLMEMALCFRKKVLME